MKKREGESAEKMTGYQKDQKEKKGERSKGGKEREKEKMDRGISCLFILGEGETARIVAAGKRGSRFGLGGKRVFKQGAVSEQS